MDLPCARGAANENGEFCATGYMPAIREGDEIDLIGQWAEHPKYGMQFNFERFEIQAPTTKRGIIAYLSSVAYGVGLVRATKIYEALGEKVLEIIQNEPQKLYELTCINEEQANQIISSFQENKILAELTALICREGITPNLAAKIVNQYGKDSLQVVKENPYKLSEDITGIGFLTADKIGRAIGIAYDSPFRIQAATKYVIQEAESEGHCFLTPNEIYFRALKLGDASKVAPVDKLSLVLVAIFAVTFLGERPSIREWLGIGMVAGGVLLLAYEH